MALISASPAAAKNFPSAVIEWRNPRNPCMNRFGRRNVYCSPDARIARSTAAWYRRNRTGESSAAANCESLTMCCTPPRRAASTKVDCCASACSDEGVNRNARSIPVSARSIVAASLKSPATTSTLARGAIFCAVSGERAMTRNGTPRAIRILMSSVPTLPDPPVMRIIGRPPSSDVRQTPSGVPRYLFPYSVKM